MSAGSSLRRPTRRRGLRLALLFLLLLMANELGSALDGLLASFSGAKVVLSLSDELPAVGRTLVGQALGIVGAASLLALPPCLLAASLALHGRAALARTLGRSRWRRWSYWFVAGLSLCHLWYALHAWFLPGSDLARSWLATLCGAPDFPTGGEVAATPRRLMLLLSVPVVAGLVACALRRSATWRRGTLASAGCAAFVVVGARLLPPAAPPAPFLAPGSVVLLGLDSFQENRLLATDGGSDPAPAVNAFLDGAFRFDNAWTPFARTYPSWVSILTGRFPARHGLRFNLGPDSSLAPDNDWLPRRLADAGYSSFHATDECRFSLIREQHGFQHLLHPPMGVQDFLLGALFDFSAANLARLTRWGHALFPAVAHNRALPSYSGRLFAEDVVAGLDELPRDRPVFAVIHLCGNHYPFTTPWPHARAGRDAVESSIAMVDDQAGRILDWLDASGLSRSGTVVLLSDHGDGWSGDPADQTNEHGDDFDQALANRVLLAARGPGITAGRAPDLVRTIDLHPTVLELAGLPWDETRVDGRPLTSWLTGRGAPPEPARALFAETCISRQSFSVKRLVQEHIDWYEMNPLTGLVFLRDEGLAEFTPLKSYMLLDGVLRLVVTPSLRRFQLREIDPRTGADLAKAPELPVVEREALLERLLAHNGLDRALVDVARQRGFLD